MQPSDWIGTCDFLNFLSSWLSIKVLHFSLAKFYEMKFLVNGLLFIQGLAKSYRTTSPFSQLLKEIVAKFFMQLTLYESFFESYTLNKLIIFNVVKLCKWNKSVVPYGETFRLSD